MNELTRLILLTLILSSKLMISPAVAQTELQPPAGLVDKEEFLPRENHVLKNVLKVSLTHHSATVPIHRATYKSKTYWYVLTDVSDEKLAKKLGLNFSAKLANAGAGCPSCVQVLNIPSDISNVDNLQLAGAVDFSPARMVVP